MRLAKPPLPHTVRARAPPVRAPLVRRPSPQLWEDYFPAGWREKIGLLIPHSRVAENVADMPVLITAACLPDYILDADGGRAALNGGGDLRFTSDLEGRDLLACHVVSFVTDNDPASATAEVWVRVPTLSATIDTMIYMWWKKAGVSQPAVAAAGGQYAVYSGLGLTHVYKLDDDQDASEKNNDLVDDGIAFVAGRIGNGGDWTAYVACSAPGWGGRTTLTVLGWVNPVLDDMAFLLDGWVNGVRLMKDPASDRLKIRVQFQWDVTDGIWDTDYYLGPGWHWIGMSYDHTHVDNDPTLVCDGRPVPMTEVQTPVGAGFSAASWYPGPWAAQAGVLDELWADDETRSAAWLVTVFNLQSDPAKSVIPCEHRLGGGRGLYRIFNAASVHKDTIAAFDENLLEYSEQFQQAGSWANIGAALVTADTDIAPDGEQTADTVADDSAVAISYLTQSVVIPDDANWVYAFACIRKDSDTSRFPEFQLILSGGAAPTVYVQLNTSTGATITRDSVGVVSVGVTDLGTYWRIELGVKNNASGNNAAHFRIVPAMTTVWGNVEAAATGSIVAWGAQGTLLALREYMPTLLRDGTYTNVRLTTGGLTNGEEFISGGNFYAVSRNGVDYVRVVGDATGEAGACVIAAYGTYRLYRKLNSPPVPGTDAPFAVVHSLPATPDLAWADGEWYISATRFNGVIESGAYPVGPAGEPYHVLTLSSGAAAFTPPQGPYSWSLEIRPGGVIRVHGVYVASGDAGAGGRADEWGINYTTDGSAPGTGAAQLTSAMSFGGLVAHFSCDLPAQEHGRNVRVLLRTRRNDGTAGSPVWTYSRNVTSELAIADAVGPASPAAADSWRGRLPEDL